MADMLKPKSETTAREGRNAGIFGKREPRRDWRITAVLTTDYADTAGWRTAEPGSSRWSFNHKISQDGHEMTNRRKWRKGSEMTEFRGASLSYYFADIL